MRIRIDHSTRYAYARPARFIVQMLRLTPKSCESQQVRDWRIETDVDARLRRSEDAFGNPSREVRKSNHEATLIPKDGGEPCIARVGTKLRHFKEALRGFLPDEILTKKKQGFGLPFGMWAMRHDGLRAMALDSVRSLAQRGVVRPGYVQQLLDQRLPEHPGYYGEMVWVLMMLEQWLASREPAAERPPSRRGPRSESRRSGRDDFWVACSRASSLLVMSPL